MKYLILFLITFNLFAQTKITITATGPETDILHFQENTLNLAIKRLKKMVKKSKWLKITKDVIESGYIFSDYDDVSEKTYYYHPVNFTIDVKDMEQEIAEQNTLKQARVDEIDQLKRMKDNIDSSNLPIWHKKLLKHYLKGLKSNE